MHDIDRTKLEFPFETDEFVSEGFAGEDEVFSQEQVEMLASELLATSSEEELNHFLGGLLKKAGSVLGKVVKSPIGQALGGVLKNAAKAGLPMLGSAVGNMILPGVGGMIGGKLASAAGSAFGLEEEGLSPEDRQFEVAKQFVRLAGDATKNALTAPSSANPSSAAASAFNQAATRYAPGLVGLGSGGGYSGSGASSGRWVRRGSRIVLYGV